MEEVQRAKLKIKLRRLLAAKREPLTADILAALAMKMVAEDARSRFHTPIK